MKKASKLFYLFGALTLAFGFFTFSCKKNSLTDVQSSEKLIDIAQRWYTDSLIQQGQGTSEAYRERIRIIGGLLDWQSAKEFYKNGIHYVVTPVKLDRKPFQNKAIEAVQNLVFYRDKSAQLHMKVIEIISANETSLGNDVSDITETAFLKSYLGVDKKTTDVNAFVVVYDQKYKTAGSYAIKNGSLIKAGFKLQLNPSSSKRDGQGNPISSGDAKVTTGSWETWYLCTIYWDVDSGEIISLTILSSWQQCVGTCDEWTPVEDPGGSNPNQCTGDVADEIAQLSGGATTTFEIEASPVTDVDAVTKYKDPKWKCLTSSSFYASSQEKGTVKLVDIPTNKWVWDVLTHDKITIIGSSPGGSVAVESEHGTPSFTPGTSNVLYGGMHLSFQLKFSPNPVCSIVLSTYTNDYEANGIWSANPAVSY